MGASNTQRGRHDDTGEPGEFWVRAYRCRCGHEWVNRPLWSGERPRMCPKCKTVNWDRPLGWRRGRAGQPESAGQGEGSRSPSAGGDA